MLEKWLETDTAKTWKDLFAVIDSPTLSYSDTSCSDTSYSSKETRINKGIVSRLHMYLILQQCYVLNPAII